MCGRTACSLDPDSLSCACEYKDSKGKRRKASWVESEVKYVPSCNLGPRDALPCLVAGSHFANEDERVLCAMMWGIIPLWHQGDYRKHNMSTHNARLESIRNSKLYSAPLRKGQRCVVVCNGFYEWKAGSTKKDTKQPYYIYTAQEDGVKADDPETWNNTWSEKTGWQGIKLLRMAGLFNIFRTAEEKIIYSCTIITRDAPSVLSWLHHRAPAFLLTEEDQQVWLDKDVPFNQAIETLNTIEVPKDSLKWHTVSTLVNNVSHKSDDCRKETKAKEEKRRSDPSAFMAFWLKKGSAESVKRKSTDLLEGNDTGKSSEDSENPPKVKKDE